MKQKLWAGIHICEMFIFPVNALFIHLCSFFVESCKHYLLKSRHIKMVDLISFLQ